MPQWSFMHNAWSCFWIPHQAKPSRSLSSPVPACFLPLTFFSLPLNSPHFLLFSLLHSFPLFLNTIISFVLHQPGTESHSQAGGDLWRQNSGGVKDKSLQNTLRWAYRFCVCLVKQWSVVCLLCDRVYLSVVLYNNGIEEKEADRQESLQLLFVAVSFFFFWSSTVCSPPERWFKKMNICLHKQRTVTFCWYTLNLWHLADYSVSSAFCPISISSE